MPTSITEARPLIVLLAEMDGTSRSAVRGALIHDWFLQMINLFKRRDWRPEIISELQGSYEGLTVRIRDFPCLVDPADGSRKFRHRGFGGEFLEEITARLLVDFNHLRADLSGGGTRTVVVRLRDLAPIEFELTGRLPSTVRAFHSDLADAIIVALASKGIEP